MIINNKEFYLGYNKFRGYFLSINYINEKVELEDLMYCKFIDNNAVCYLFAKDEITYIVRESLVDDGIFKDELKYAETLGFKMKTEFKYNNEYLPPK